MAITAIHFQFKILNSSVDPSNYAIVDLDVGNAIPDPKQVAAQFTAFLIGSDVCAAGTSVASATFRGPSVAGATPVGDWTAEGTAIKAAYTGLAHSPWPGESFGNGDLTPVGTSATLSEYSATAGRSATGRMYLPFIGVPQVAGDGSLAFSIASAINGAYSLFLMGDGATAPVVDLMPTVVSKKLTTQYPVTVPLTSRTLANLRSRRS
jgi:hypothetical protein